MKGYVILSYERNMQFRDKHFVDEVSPEFWGNNSHLIDTVWEIDTDNDTSMHRLFSSLKTKEIPARDIKDLCTMLNFNLEAFIDKRKAEASALARQSVVDRQAQQPQQASQAT